MLEEPERRDEVEAFLLEKSDPRDIILPKHMVAFRKLWMTEVVEEFVDLGGQELFTVWHSRIVGSFVV